MPNLAGQRLLSPFGADRRPGSVSDAVHSIHLCIFCAIGMMTAGIPTELRGSGGDTTVSFVSESRLADHDASTAGVPGALRAVLLAPWVPWRAFPVVRRLRVSLLLIFCRVSPAGSVGLSLYGYPWGSPGFTLSRYSVLVQQIRSHIWPFIGLYVLLTLSAASRQQRVGRRC
jgi:hypothetical protein